MTATVSVNAYDRPTPPDTGANGKMHSAVVRRLGGRILGGEFKPGESLPGEGELALTLAVSRTTIREAIKVLSAKGLIESRPRIGIRVRAQEDWRVLDPDLLSWHPDIRRDARFLESLVESRRIIEPAAAEIAAERATAQDLALIECAYDSMRKHAQINMSACNEADVQFHHAVIGASHNIVLKALTSTIEAALRAAFFVTSEYMDKNVIDAHYQIMERIRFRDSEGARKAMLHLLDIAAEDLYA